MNYEFIKYNIENLKPDEILEYLRKSRSDDPALTVEEVLARHESILRDWAIANVGSEIPEQNIYREVVSGETIKERPEVQKLLRMIESPHIRAVSIVEPQRLTRGDLEDIGRLMKLIKYTNTLIITPTKIYDLSDKYDWESFERELKRGNEFLEYTKTILNRGRLRSVSEGNYIASIPPYGYDKTIVVINKKKCPSLCENKEQADTVRMIFDMYVNQDMGSTSIAYALDNLGIKPPRGVRWSPAAIQDMLSNMHYIGKVVWNWRKTITVVEDSEIVKTRPKAKVGDFLVYEGRHDGIVPEELFNAAQEKRGRCHRAKASTKVRNPLAGLVYCSCGRSMSLRTYHNKDGSVRSEARLLCDGQVYCKTSSVLYSEMYNRVRGLLQDSIRDFELKISNASNDKAKLHKNLISQLEKRLAELNEKELKIWDEKALNRGTENEMPDHVFKKLNENIKKEQTEIHQALSKAYENVPKNIDYEEKLYKFKDALAALDDTSISALKQNSLLKACIDRITYSRTKAVRITKKNCTEYGIDIKDLKTGGNWHTPEFELDVKLKI